MNEQGQRGVSHAAILAAAVALAGEVGYQRLTRDTVADRAGVAGSTIHSNFRSMDALRSAVLTYAVEHELLPLIAQGLAVGAVETRDISATLKRRAADSTVSA